MKTERELLKEHCYVIDLQYVGLLEFKYFTSFEKCVEFIREYELQHFENDKITIGEQPNEIIGRFDTYRIVDLKRGDINVK